MNHRDFFSVCSRILVYAMSLLLIADIWLRMEEEHIALMPPPSRTRAIVQKATEIRDDLNVALNLLEDCFGNPVDLHNVKSVPVTVTAYSSTRGQCDASPFLTASQNSVRIGIIAVSDDLVEEFGLHFGQRVLIPGHGLFEVQDRMNPRWKRRVDIWQENREVARHFGMQKGTLIWLDQENFGLDMVASTSQR